MQCSCGFCAALSPRYKRLVNNIYPASPTDCYDKSNLEKLTFYARAHTQKLDRIGNHLAQRISRDLCRQRLSHVAIGVEAMDRLLITTNAQSPNLFVEIFLRVVQQLVESQELSMQLLGTRSLSGIIAVAASESIGPSVLEIINSLLEHLRTSINSHGKRDIEFQEAIMDTLGEFLSNLPDSQKTEILHFIKSRAPTFNPDSVISIKLQKILHDPEGSGTEAHFEECHEPNISKSEMNPISDDVESIASSSDEDRITFKSFKKSLTDETQLEPLDEKKGRIVSWFMNATFEELVERAITAKCPSGDYYTLSLDLASKCIA